MFAQEGHRYVSLKYNIWKGATALLICCITVTVLIIYQNEGLYQIYASAFVQHNQISSFKLRTDHNAGFPRVMCMIFVTVGKWEKRGEAVTRTWSRHCYRRRFFYSREGRQDVPPAMRNVSHEAVALDVPEGRQYLTNKTMSALQYSFRLFQNDTDWYLKADDDVYIVYHNLLNYLSRFNSDNPHYLGSVFRTMKHVPHGYNSGGAGYLLSQRAATLAVTQGRKLYPKTCGGQKVGGWEDVDMGDCLQKFKIYPTNTKDSEERERFESENPLTFLRTMLHEVNNGFLEKTRSATYRGMTFGKNEDKSRFKVLSNESISFHYVSPAEIYWYDFLLSLQPTESLSQKQSEVDIRASQSSNSTTAPLLLQETVSNNSTLS